MADSRPALHVFTDIPLKMDPALLRTWWYVFRTRFLSYAATLGRYEFTGGVMASIISEAEFNTFWAPILWADIIPANPGALLPGADAHLHREERAIFTRYTTYLEAIMTTWTSHVDDSALQALMHPRYGLANVPLAAQFQLIAATSSDLPSDYLEEMRTRIEITIIGGLIRLN
jgi:hypothetical protein